jgi:chromate reductase
MRVLGISGSLRRDSLNSGLLRAAADLLPPGAELAIYDDLKSIPPYDADDDRGEGPAEVDALRHAIERADAILIATPEYNGSIPGQLKNALDWVSRPIATNPLRGKPVGTIGASPGSFGAIWAQADLRKVVGIIGGKLVGEETPIAEADLKFDEAGRLTDEDAREALTATITELVDAHNGVTHLRARP